MILALKRGMAEMQKGGVIMDVINVELAKIVEVSGVVAVIKRAVKPLALAMGI